MLGGSLGTICLLLFTRLSRGLAPGTRWLRGQVAASPAHCLAGSTVNSGISGHLLPAPLSVLAIPQARAHSRSFPLGSLAPAVPRSCRAAACLRPATQEVSESPCTLLSVSASPHHLGKMVLKEYFSTERKSATSLSSACLCFSSHPSLCSSLPHQLPLPASPSPPILD